jgi:putative FmdB family regulatory protein
MPQYDYRCPECSSRFIITQSFEDNSIPDCIHCEKPMQKVFSPTPAHFKGGGWGSSK